MEQKSMSRNFAHENLLFPLPRTSWRVLDVNDAGDICTGTNTNTDATARPAFASTNSAATARPTLASTNSATATWTASASTNSSANTNPVAITNTVITTRMKTLHFIHGMFLASIASAFLLPSCVMNRTHSLAKPQVTVKKTTPPLFEWMDEEATGSLSVRISLTEQKAYIYRDGKQVAWTMLATGRPHHRTPTGHFTILEKLPEKPSNTYGVIADSNNKVINWDAEAGVTPVPEGCRFIGSPMPHWMRITDGGVGMHQGDIPNPGQTASHGCIRLPGELATKLYEIAEVGTSVTITGTPPDEE